MFLSKIRKRKAGDEINVVERVQAWTSLTELIPHDDKFGKTQPNITIDLPLTVDGALLAHQIEHQIKRRGIA